MQAEEVVQSGGVMSVGTCRVDPKASAVALSCDVQCDTVPSLPGK